MAVDQTTPVADNLVKVLVEFFETDHPVRINVHQGEAELALLIIGSIAKDVHDRDELVEDDHAVTVRVKHFEDSVC